MNDDILKNAIKGRMGGFQGLSIEIKPMDSESEKQALQKQGMAPALPEKDQEVKAQGVDTAEGIEGPNEPEDIDVALTDELLDDDEQDDYLMQAMEGRKPKGIIGKAEQRMVANKVAKSQKPGKA